MARLPRPCASCQLRITPLPRPRASRLRDGVRLSVRGPGSVNGNGAGVYNAIPDANVRRGAAVVAVSGEGDAAGIYCCGSSNDTAEGGRFMSVGAHVSGVRVTADCEVAVVALISHVPGNAADAPPVSISRSADGAPVGATRDGAVVFYMRDNAAQYAAFIISIEADGAADGDILHGSINDFCKQSALL